MERIRVLDFKTDKWEKYPQYLKESKASCKVYEQYLYITYNNYLYKYDLANMCMATDKIKLDIGGRISFFADDYIFLIDIQNLYIIDKNDFLLKNVMTLKEAFNLGGKYPTSDLGSVFYYNHSKVYITVRNGWIYILDIVKKEIEKIQFNPHSCWNVFEIGDHFHFSTVKGELIELNKSSLKITRKTKISKTNLAYMEVYDNKFYTIARDETIRVIDIATHEIIQNSDEKAVETQASLAGIYKNQLFVADWNKIKVFDVETLQRLDIFPFPTDKYSAGVWLHDNKLFSTDEKGLFFSILD